jgi:hypothetical protein
VLAAELQQLLAAHHSGISTATYSKCSSSYTCPPRWQNQVSQQLHQAALMQQLLQMMEQHPQLCQ